MNADDRILEYALRQHFAATPPMDLAQDIAQRWSNGEHGSLSAGELGELMRDPGPYPSVEAASGPRSASLSDQASRRPYLLFALAAAGLISLLLGLREWSTAGDQRPSISPQPSSWQAELQAPMRVLGLPGSASSPSRLLRSGDVVLVSEGNHEVALAQGLQLQLAAPALFRVAEHAGELSLDLFAGEFHLDSAEGTAMSVNGMRVASLAQSRLELRAEGESGPMTQALSDLRAEGLLQTRPSPELIVTLESGELQLGSGTEARSLGPGKGVVLFAPQRLADLGAWKDARLALAEIMPMGAEGMTKRVYWSRELALEQAGMLAKLLMQEPALWEVLERELQSALQADQFNRQHASIVLDMLVGAELARPQEMARALWLREPSLFAAPHITRMAQMGHFEFEREVAAQLDLWRQWPEEFEQPPLLFAIQAAFVGDDRGREILDLALREPGPELLQSGDLALVALGLEALGESSAWELALDKLEARVEGFLQEGELGAAALLLTRLESLADYRLDPLEHSRSSGTSELALPADKFIGEPGSPAELRARLRAVIGR